MSTAIEQKIDNQIVRAIHLLGDEYFKECQKRIPVESLGEIGTITKVGNSLETAGWTVAYESALADEIHEGIEGQPGFTWISTTKAHMRTTSSGRRVQVRRHRKQYNGYKPTYVPRTEGKPYAYIQDRGSIDEGGIWYSKNMSTTVPSQPWMDEAWEAIRDREPKWFQEVLPMKITQTQERSIRRD